MDRSTRELTEDERLDWLRLARTANVGPRTFADLLRRFGSAAEALANLPDLARRGGRTIRPARREDAEREMAAGLSRNARLLASCEPAYPARLAAIDDPPPVLWALGDSDLLNRPAVGVVGARNASSAGRRLARDFAAGLGAAGYVVASGLARGVDSAAHQAALPTGTVAAMAGGIDVVYPPENEGLYREIAERGCAVSEHPPGTAPTARHFPPRNRLISGVALGVLVVEAAQRSGSLITARLALEQGREVFAVPGSPLDPRCRGSNGLLRQGAVLAECADDVVEALEGMARRPAAPPPEAYDGPPDAGPAADGDLDGARRQVAALLGPVPVTVDELARECQLSAAVTMTVLLELEIAGRVERHPGQRVSLAS